MDTCIRNIPLCICRSLRLAAYRNFIYWTMGKLGKKNRLPVPACAVNRIRDCYPEESGIYEGFKEAVN